MAAKENVSYLLLLFVILLFEQVSISGENFLTKRDDLINARRKEFVSLVDAYYSLLNICIMNLITVF